MTPVSAQSGLARQSLGAVSLLFFTVSASAPMTVLAGSVVATYATTGVRGVPLSFLILAVALLLFLVGYVSMARYVSNAGPFYAYVARGLGKVWGVSGGLVALLSYNAIQIALYGLFGATAADLLGAFPWWVWALAAWAAVAALGVLRININAGVLAVLLICEVGMVLIFDLGAFTDPAGGSVSMIPLEPGSLLVSGIGGVLAFGIAAFVGVELGPVYGEEARNSTAVTRATLAAVVIIGVLYAVSSWALAVTLGPDRVIEATRNPDSGIPFSIIETHYGPVMATFARLFLLTSIFAAMLSFHGTVARYTYTLARDGVLPAAVRRIGSGAGGGAPIMGSVLQSLVAFLVVVSFALSGSDPIATLFTWLAALAAVGVMALMVATSLAVIGFFRRRPELPEGIWNRSVAPALGAIFIFVMLITTVFNMGSLLGTTGTTTVQWVLTGIVVLFAGMGLIWGALLRNARPAVFDQVGEGLSNPLAALDHSLERYRL